MSALLGGLFIGAGMLASAAILSAPVERVQMGVRKFGLSLGWQWALCSLLALSGMVIIMIGRPDATVTSLPSTSQNAPSPAAEVPPPAKSLATVSTITRVDVNEPNIWMWSELRGQGTPGSVIQAGIVAQTVGRAIQAGARGPDAKTRHVQMIYTVPTIDRLGREGRAQALRLQFSIADLKLAKYSNLDPHRVLNLVQNMDIADQTGGGMIDAYCSAYDISRGPDRFCRLAAAVRGRQRVVHDAMPLPVQDRRSDKLFGRLPGGCDPSPQNSQSFPRRMHQPACDSQARYLDPATNPADPSVIHPRILYAPIKRPIR